MADYHSAKRVHVPSHPSALIAQPGIPVTQVGFTEVSNRGVPTDTMPGHTLAIDSEFYPLVIVLQKLQREGMWSFIQRELRKLLVQEHSQVLKLFSEKKMNKHIRNALDQGIMSRDIQRPGMTRKAKLNGVRLAEKYSISCSREEPEVPKITSACSSSLHDTDLSRLGGVGLTEAIDNTNFAASDPIVSEETDTIKSNESHSVPMLDSSSFLGLTVDNSSVMTPENTQVATLQNTPNSKEPLLPSCGPSEPSPPLPITTQNLQIPNLQNRRLAHLLL